MDAEEDVKGWKAERLKGVKGFALRRASAQNHGAPASCRLDGGHPAAR